MSLTTCPRVDGLLIDDAVVFGIAGTEKSTLEQNPDQDAVVLGFADPQVDLTKWGLSKINPTKFIDFLDHFL